MKDRPRVFELEAANALIPELETFLAGFEEKEGAFRRLQDELFFEELLEEFGPPEEKLQGLERVLEQLERELEKIRGLGCILRHPEKGLVDFLARKGDEWIYYCWRRGEKEILFYHSLRGGYYERRPLLEEERSQSI